MVQQLAHLLIIEAQISKDLGSAERGVQMHYVCLQDKRGDAAASTVQTLRKRKSGHQAHACGCVALRGAAPHLQPALLVARPPDRDAAPRHLRAAVGADRPERLWRCDVDDRGGGLGGGGDEGLQLGGGVRRQLLAYICVRASGRG